MVGVDYGDEENTIVGLPAHVNSMMKNEQRQILRAKVEESVVQQVRLCKI